MSKQSSLSSFFTSKSHKDGSLNDPPKTSVSDGEKVRLDPKEDGNKISEETERAQLGKRDPNIVQGDVRKKARRIIDDDDEEEETHDTKVQSTEPSKPDSETKAKEVAASGGSTAKTPKETESNLKKAASSNRDNKMSEPAPPKKSDATLSSIEPPVDNGSLSNWKGNVPTPYLVLCETFSSIEAITSRLEIQKILTRLFRQCLEKSPHDLLPTVYLASNSVAPAYKCVELGVGDAILIKAVGEASGTNPGTFLYVFVLK